jgi:hypothetical protein
MKVNNIQYLNNEINKLKLFKFKNDTIFHSNLHKFILKVKKNFYNYDNKD